MDKWYNVIFEISNDIYQEEGSNWDGAPIKRFTLYVNGEEVGSSFSYWTANFSLNGTLLAFGRDGQLNSQYFNGAMENRFI